MDEIGRFIMKPNLVLLSLRFKGNNVTTIVLMWVNLAISQIRKENRTKDEKKRSFPFRLFPRALNGHRRGKLFDNFFISFYLWLNFLNLMIALSCSLWQRLYMV